MPDITLDMPANSVGLVVRGKLSPEHAPGVMEQHADCVLPDGSPIGFFGEGNDQSGNSIGMRMKGVVYDFALLQTNRVYYVDFDSSVGYGVVSTLLIVTVTKDQADKFRLFWQKLKTDPGSFNILGGNCSTHASDGFISAGILVGGIPGLDTPDNLYKQLAKQYKGKCSSLSGHFGFVPKTGGGFRIKHRPVVQSPNVNTKKSTIQSSASR